MIPFLSWMTATVQEDKPDPLREACIIAMATLRDAENHAADLRATVRAAEATA